MASAGVPDSVWMESQRPVLDRSQLRLHLVPVAASEPTPSAPARQPQLLRKSTSLLGSRSSLVGQPKRRLSSLLSGLRLGGRKNSSSSSSHDDRRSPTLSIRSSSSWLPPGSSVVAPRRFPPLPNREKLPPKLVGGARFVPQLLSPLPSLENFWETQR